MDPRWQTYIDGEQAAVLRETPPKKQEQKPLSAAYKAKQRLKFFWEPIDHVRLPDTSDPPRSVNDVLIKMAALAIRLKYKGHRGRDHGNMILRTQGQDLCSAPGTEKIVAQIKAFREILYHELIRDALDEWRKNTGSGPGAARSIPDPVAWLLRAREGHRSEIAKLNLKNLALSDRCRYAEAARDSNLRDVKSYERQVAKMKEPSGQTLLDQLDYAMATAVGSREYEPFRKKMEELKGTAESKKSEMEYLLKRIEDASSFIERDKESKSGRK